RPGLSLINSLVSLPGLLSFIFPVVEQIGIAECFNGNEKMNFPLEYFCFSPPMTDSMRSVSYGLAYRSHLSDLLKEDVCHELYRRYPSLVKYQYSCWMNHGRRWCMRCQSCLQYYLLLKNAGLPVQTAGMEEEEIESNLEHLIWTTASSKEA